MLNGLKRWVDPRVPNVRLAELTSYLRNRGWTQRPAPRPQQLAFQHSAAGGNGPSTVHLPSSEQFADYSQRVLEVITELAEIEDRNAVEVLNDILKGQRSATPNGAVGEAAPSENAGAR